MKCNSTIRTCHVSSLLGASLRYRREYGCAPVLHRIFSSFSFFYRRSRYGQVIRARLAIWVVVNFSGNFSGFFVAEQWPIRVGDTGTSCPYGRSLKSLVPFVEISPFAAQSAEVIRACPTRMATR
jgi:hypothetical protein